MSSFFVLTALFLTLSSGSKCNVDVYAEGCVEINLIDGNMFVLPGEQISMWKVGGKCQSKDSCSSNAAFQSIQTLNEWYFVLDTAASYTTFSEAFYSSFFYSQMSNMKHFKAIQDGGGGIVMALEFPFRISFSKDQVPRISSGIYSPKLNYRDVNGLRFGGLIGSNTQAQFKTTTQIINGRKTYMSRVPSEDVNLAQIDNHWVLDTITCDFGFGDCDKFWQVPIRVGGVHDILSNRMQRIMVSLYKKAWIKINDEDLSKGRFRRSLSVEERTSLQEEVSRWDITHDETDEKWKDFIGVMNSYGSFKSYKAQKPQTTKIKNPKVNNNPKK